MIQLLIHRPHVSDDVFGFELLLEDAAEHFTVCAIRAVNSIPVNAS